MQFPERNKLIKNKIILFQKSITAVTKYQNGLILYFSGDHSNFGQVLQGK